VKRTLLVATLFAVCAAPAHACLGNPRAPRDTDIGKYPVVLDVTVTGVHLSAYEHYVLSERGIVEFCPDPDPADPDYEELRELECVYPASSTPAFEVRGLVDHAWKGTSEPTLDVVLGGCNVREPSLRATGLVFLDPATGDAKAVWDSQFPERVARMRELLAKEFGAPPTSPAIEDPSETTSHAPANLPPEN
jgi:hypothetical protein